MTELLAPGVRLLEKPAPDLVLLDAGRHFRHLFWDLQRLWELSTHVLREGAGPGSLTEAGLEYRVIDGSHVAEYMPELFEAYLDFAPAATLALGKKLEPSQDMRSCVNINLLRGKGACYELHVDSQPYTAILFVGGGAHGGQLRVTQPARPKDKVHDQTLRSYSGGAEWRFEPTPGNCVLFDGHMYPHEVLPVEDDTMRVTVPMVFVDPEQPEVREEGLDDHLY